MTWQQDIFSMAFTWWIVDFLSSEAPLESHVVECSLESYMHENYKVNLFAFAWTVLWRFLSNLQGLYGLYDLSKNINPLMSVCPINNT